MSRLGSGFWGLSDAFNGTTALVMERLYEEALPEECGIGIIFNAVQHLRFAHHSHPFEFASVEYFERKNAEKMMPGIVPGIHEQIEKRQFQEWYVSLDKREAA